MCGKQKKPECTHTDTHTLLKASHTVLTALGWRMMMYSSGVALTLSEHSGPDKSATLDLE